MRPNAEQCLCAVLPTPIPTLILPEDIITKGNRIVSKRKELFLAKTVSKISSQKKHKVEGSQEFDQE